MLSSTPTNEQKIKIKELTGFEFERIIKMDDAQFFFNITKLFTKNIITARQHQWLHDQRLTGDITAVDLRNAGLI